MGAHKLFFQGDKTMVMVMPQKFFQGANTIVMANIIARLSKFTVKILVCVFCRGQMPPLALICRSHNKRESELSKI